MSWALIVSISLNIVSVLVYFKIPEIIQGLIMKKVDYKYSINIEVWKRKQEVLPELFEKAALAQSYYEMNYDAKGFFNTEMKYYVELKNFITIKQFYISKSIINTARKIEKEILNLISAKGKNDEEKVEEISANVEQLIKQLEFEIQEEFDK